MIPLVSSGIGIFLGVRGNFLYSRHLENNGYRPFIIINANSANHAKKQFSEYIFERTQDLTFFIGGPDGHPQVIEKESKSILSLSNLTLPHEMALLVLAEQIFRAISIKKGSKYHR